MKEKNKPKQKQKSCGNCGNHTTYNYPTEIFCGKRFSEKKNPIVKVSWCCEDWNPASQECYCLEEAAKDKRQ
jgi:hypothetical protein